MWDLQLPGNPTPKVFLNSLKSSATKTRSINGFPVRAVGPSLTKRTPVVERVIAPRPLILTGSVDEHVRPCPHSSRHPGVAGRHRFQSVNTCLCAVLFSAYISARVSSYFHSLSVSLQFQMPQIQSGHLIGSRIPQTEFRELLDESAGLQLLAHDVSAIFIFFSLFCFLLNPQHVSDTNRLPSVLACYFHHRPLVSPEHAAMVTDETVAAEGLVWHRMGQRDGAGHFLSPRGGITALCKSTSAPSFFST